MSEVKKESKVNNEEVRLTLLKCREWIKENYENSSIAVNDELGNEVDETFEGLLHDLTEFAFYQALPLCGCGYQDETIELIRDYLGILKFRGDDPMNNWDKAGEMFRERFKGDNACFDPLFQFMAYTLDDRDITDHGSGISGAWLTRLGDVVWYILDIYLKNEYPEDYEDKPKEEVKNE